MHGLAETQPIHGTMVALRIISQVRKDASIIVCHSMHVNVLEADIKPLSLSLLQILGPLPPGSPPTLSIESRINGILQSVPSQLAYRHYP